MCPSFSFTGVMTNIEELLKSDPGNSAFFEYAESLRLEGALDHALHVLLAGLSANPNHARGRLQLARVFYEMGYTPFAVKELQLLQQQAPDNAAIQKLLERLAPMSSRAPSSEANVATSQQAASEKDATLAEAEFDIDDLPEQVGPAPARK